MSHRFTAPEPLEAAEETASRREARQTAVLVAGVIAFAAISAGSLLDGARLLMLSLRNLSSVVSSRLR